jgi:la-related protein 1
MYDEFCRLAFEDAADHRSEVGLSNLLKFYVEAMLSSQNLMRERVARDYINLVHSENGRRHAAPRQLETALRHCTLNPRNRERIDNLLKAQSVAVID